MENWPDWRQALADGELCCKAATAERLAELWCQGIDARPFLSWSVLPDGPQKGLIMYHYRVWRPLASMNIDPPPFLETPWGPTIVEGPPGDKGEAGIIECPSIVLGLYWEAAFATTNRRPSTPEFFDRLTTLMGKTPRTWPKEPARKAAGGLALRKPALPTKQEIDKALDQFLANPSMTVPPEWSQRIVEREPVATAIYAALCKRAKTDPKAAMVAELMPSLHAANAGAMGYARGNGAQR